MSDIEHFSTVERCKYVAVKTKELTLKQTLSVPCPTCGAATEKACELRTGTLRTEPAPKSEAFRSRGHGDEA
jgi:hypothetical protein